MIYLHKIIATILSPLFMALFLIIIGLLTKRIWAWLGVIVLLIASNPIIGNHALAYLEHDYPPQNIEDAPNADYILILGGMIRTIPKENSELVYEYTDAVDRILAGVKLYRAQKAPKIILTRGKLPWEIGDEEGDILRLDALEMGVPDEDIILTVEVENTADEAQAVKATIPEDASVLLVTSAFHMPRASAIFKNAGINVIPYAVDYRAITHKKTPMDFIPSSQALNATTLWSKEMLGRLYYSLRFWV